MAVTSTKAELLRRGYEAFQTGDMETLRELFHPDIVWHQQGRNLLAGDFRGIDAVLENFGRMFVETDGTFRVDLHDILESDDHVVALASTSATRKGRSLNDQPYAHVCHYRDGKLVEAWILDVDPYAADEFFQD